jgi:hypothetical protein
VEVVFLSWQSLARVGIKVARKRLEATFANWQASLFERC